MSAKTPVDLLIKGGQVITPPPGIYPLRGKQLAELRVIEDGWVACQAGTIVAVGEEAEVRSQIDLTPQTEIIDAAGCTITPGLIDAHTHVIFGGTREDEFYLRAQGAEYMEIMAAGGGIRSTVQATRAAALDELVEKGRQHLEWMLDFGVTTVECKSGYGLDLATEMKQLEAVKRLAREQPLELVSTYMGAHAWPDEYGEDRDGYLGFMMDTVLPQVREGDLAEFVDVFCETGVFSVDQSRAFLKRAAELGFKLRIHAEEMSTLGGAQLAAEVGAASADHLLMISEEGIKALAQSDVVPVLLPATAFALRKPYAPARRMIEAGLPLALATDFNPGSCPNANLPLVMSIACLYMAMTPEEVFNAVTINAAHSLRRADRLGSLEPGKQADLVIFAAENYKQIPYFFGVNLVKTVIKAGKIVKNG
ncbi:MAG: imidazolonepropionase [Firmicutes bacterium]|jgi:imidazolonepropionase|nr:imidazolonepropionase [Bacillota bacterium]NLO65730.1 imidazolonepropionase [Bacillota bacterium]